MKSSNYMDCSLVCIVIGAVAMIAGVSNGQPPGGGQFKQCHNKSTYTEPSTCFPAGMCTFTGICIQGVDFPYDCPGGGCPAGGCSFFNATNVVQTGFCSYDQTSSKYCDYCEWLACAVGNYYANFEDCDNEENAVCTGCLWAPASCL
jgi:hypothetical protein